MPENEAVATPAAEFMAIVQDACANADELIALNRIAIEQLVDIPGIPEESFEFANKTIITLSTLKMLVTKLTEHSLEVDDAMSAIKDEIEKRMKE